MSRRQPRNLDLQMSFALNVLWLLSGGLWVGLVWCCVGLACYVSLVLIPFGFACFRIANIAFCPFGRELISAQYLGERVPAMSLAGNVVWAVCFGWWLSLLATVIGLAHFITIVGIPWAIAYFRIAAASFAPLGKRVVTGEIARLAKRRYVERLFDGAEFVQNQV